MAEDKVYLLTQEAYNKMKEELAHREGELREEIAHKIAVARAEGDLSENGGYQAAREAQSKNEGRITELTVKLRNATIVEAPKGRQGRQRVAGDAGARRPRDDVCAGLARHQGRDEVRRDQPRVSHRRRHSGRQRGRYGELQGPQRP